MATSAKRTSVCANCGKTFKRKAARGRPNKYCKPSCGFALRRKPVQPPDPSHDIAVAEIGYLLRKQIGDLVVETVEDATSEDLLRRHAGLVRHLPDLEAALVRRGRARGETWQAMGAALSISSHRLRKKWTAEALERWEEHRAARTVESAAPRPPTPHTAPWPTDPTADTGETADEAALPAPVTQVGSVGNQLAVTLSHLQRHSGQTMRQIAAYALISPSYLSKITAGIRRPSWPVTQRLAEAYQIAPGHLRPLWEATIQQEPDPPPDPGTGTASLRLNTALRSQYLAAGRPDLWTIKQATAGTLSIATIARTLKGPSVHDWDTTGRLVLALNGDLAHTKNLWDAAPHPLAVACEKATAGPLTPALR
ncbi:helix-turn-helix domain-containing protein [Streptomyces sp. NPDC051773]|uniref:helix-turn-helix domain-containing protein n=1 Tax=Streptomyces sp. NPDC051773 TaxID=3156682 RepID=UPI003444B5ED